MIKPFTQLLLAGYCCLTVSSCAVIQSISQRTEVIHALSDQAQLSNPLSGNMATLTSDISFPRNRYYLTNAQRSRLLKSAPAWKAAAKPIVIVGFASNGGLPEYSRMLSQRRAEEVRAVLISAGFEAATVHSIGFGNDVQNQTGGDFVRLYVTP